ncbi:MAG: glycoside hydrolase family 15 protein [Nocardioidaceae bacterium]
MSNVPLAEHALLTDCRTAALVTAHGSVDWLCLPRFDSAPVLGRLLDPDAGHFSIAPDDEQASGSWQYRRNGLVLETTWSVPGGELTVVDALALGRNERGHGLGLTSPGVLLRSAHCTSGSVAVRVEYAPRPELALVHPSLSHRGDDIVSRGGATVVVLTTDAALDLSGGMAAATITLAEGQRITFAMQQYDAWGDPAKSWTPHQAVRRLTSTEKSWRSWSELHQRYDGPLRSLVHHSGVVLRGLTYAPSGAMVAAPTTSLPEGVGSARTWDYRYTWVRDASMTMQGLFIAACPDEAGRFFSFLSTAAATQLMRGVDLQIMFGIGGERDLSEHELPHLAGWRNSRPVRTGNEAWSQRQLDVYGAVLDAAYTLRVQLARINKETRRFLVAAVDAAMTRWDDDDQGIWEVRGAARPYLHSKRMCWVALDRGIALAEQLHAEDRVPAWEAQRVALAERIYSDGWNEQVGAFTQYFGSDDVDASALVMAIVRFLPPDDPRLLATIDVVEAQLSDERGLLYRYRGDDGLEGPEGTFLLCTFWLAHALALTGQVDRSREVLERAASYATELGLFAEQVDPTTGELLGNFPQAFSHLGLVTAAQALADAEQATPPPHRRPVAQSNTATDPAVKGR